VEIDSFTHQTSNSPEKKKELKKQCEKTMNALSSDITRFENDFKVAEAEKQVASSHPCPCTTQQQKKPPKPALCVPFRVKLE